MFPHKFFARVYFAARYFAQAVGLIPNTAARMVITVDAYGATTKVAAYSSVVSVSGVQES